MFMNIYILHDKKKVNNLGKRNLDWKLISYRRLANDIGFLNFFYHFFFFNLDIYDIKKGYVI